MQASAKHIWLTVILSMLLCFMMKAQQDKDEQALTDILTSLGERYEYRFNYAEDNVENIALSLPSDSLSFEEALSFLRTQTGLAYTILNDHIVSVKPKTAFFLCGYIKNNETGEAMIDVNIDAEGDGAISDASGYFELNVKGEHKEIKISHLGFETLYGVFASFSKGDCSDIYLIPRKEQLREVIVSGYLVNGIDKLSDGSFEIDFSKYSLLPGVIDTDALHSVQAFPGVQSINETVSNISIRGGTHDQNLILWDGIKMYQAGHFFGLISIFNPRMSREVSLRKNGTDASRTGGVSGTISMNSDKAINRDFKGSIGINFIDVNGFSDIPLGERSSVQIAARRSLSDFARTPTSDEYLRRITRKGGQHIANSDKQFSFYDTSVRWLYHISDKDKLRINFIKAHDKLMFDENPRNEAPLRGSIKQNSMAGGLYYERNWNNAWQSVFQMYRTGYGFKIKDIDILPDVENIVWETAVKLNASYKIKDSLLLQTGGYEYTKIRINNIHRANPSGIDTEVRTHGLYSQFHLASEDFRTRFRVGLRLNYIENFKKLLPEPRLNLNHKFMDHFTLEILGEIKHQSISQIIGRTFDIQAIENRLWRLSNDYNFPVIVSRQSSLGLSYNRSGWLISAEGYYKNVKGITTYSEGFNSPLSRFLIPFSKGRYHVQGIDFLVRKKFKSSNIWLSYSYMDNKYTFNAVSETAFPGNFDINHAISFGATYTSKNLKLSAGCNWHSGLPITPAIPYTNVGTTTDGIRQDHYNWINNVRLKDYFRVDASAVFKFDVGLKSKADFGLSVWNLLNRKNISGNFYTGTNEEGEAILQNGLRLTLNALLRIHL